MHFFMSLLWLGAVITLISFYFLALCGSFLGIRHVYRLWKRRKTRDIDKNQLPPFIGSPGKKMVVTGLVLLLCFNVVTYINQRSTWMGPDNSHLDAKEYYVAGQVLYFYRSVLSKFKNPDRWYVMPMVWLQEAIYKVGIKYLPEGDGEIGIWTDTWFIYPYSKKLSIPLGVIEYYNNNQSSPEMITFLERVWHTLETVATKPIADTQMREQHYHRNFPGMTHYYAYSEGYYMEKKTGSGMTIAKEPKHVKRSELLADWLLDLEKKWQTSEKTKAFIASHPEVETMRLTTLIMELGDIVIGRINARGFDCNDPFFAKLVEARKQFYDGTENSNPTYRRMKDKRMAQKLYFIAIDSMAARFDYLVLTEYCGLKIAGIPNMEEDRNIAKVRNQTIEEFFVWGIKGLFHEEIDLLEEQLNDH